MRFSDICGKEVINIADGCLIGHVADLEFDSRTFEIFAIYATPCKSFMKKIFPWIFPVEQIQISVSEIENIHGDVILVHFHS